MGARGPKVRTRMTPVQSKALDRYLHGWPVHRICEHLQVSNATFNNWRRCPGPFQDALRAALEDVEWTASADIRQLVKSSLQELDGLLQDPNPQIRLGAARLSLEAYQQMVATREQKELMVDLEARMEALQAGAQHQLPEGVIEADIQEIGHESRHDGPEQEEAA